MKIALIAPGRRQIPSKNPGAIEVLIWNYKQHLERLGHSVDIYNTIWIHETVYELNKKNYDFIHLHFDLYALFCNKYLDVPYCVTTHSGGLSHFIPNKNDYYPAYNYLFEDCKNAPGNIVLSDQIKNIFEQNEYKKFLRVMRNPVEVEKFNFVDKGNGKAIYVGNINFRKKQAFWAKKFREDVRIDFVGPLIEGESRDFETLQSKSYLGIWDKETIYNNLTGYSTLVLLSESEADPLVVKEALAAGLSVVVNEASSANLTNKKFITVLPDSTIDGDEVSDVINDSIDRNYQYRKQIREYAYDRFSYNVIIREYINIIEEFKDYYKKV